ncbi:Hypothetical protein CINCED_3A016214 [Cinara cedri]|uniref:Uncharacterized protein n=1 Tax=Cinara cedri TaxID=506608 RepID=A0A5E4M023_9HEMI|nr:Hypothetical protein CINCED_3A016214 [Cinara cedri]
MHSRDGPLNQKRNDNSWVNELVVELKEGEIVDDEDNVDDKVVESTVRNSKTRASKDNYVPEHVEHSWGIERRYNTIMHCPRSNEGFSDLSWRDNHKDDNRKKRKTETDNDRHNDNVTTTQIISSTQDNGRCTADDNL